MSKIIHKESALLQIRTPETGRDRLEVQMKSIGLG